MSVKTTYFRCLQHNPPELFITKQGLDEHWNKTHTVAQVTTEADPWGERAPRTKKLTDEAQL